MFEVELVVSYRSAILFNRGADELSFFKEHALLLPVWYLHDGVPFLDAVPKPSQVLITSNLLVPNPVLLPVLPASKVALVGIWKLDVSNPFVPTHFEPSSIPKLPALDMSEANLFILVVVSNMNVCAGLSLPVSLFGTVVHVAFIHLTITVRNAESFLYVLPVRRYRLHLVCAVGEVHRYAVQHSLGVHSYPLAVLGRLDCESVQHALSEVPSQHLQLHRVVYLSVPVELVVPEVTSRPDSLSRNELPDPGPHAFLEPAEKAVPAGDDPPDPVVQVVVELADVGVLEVLDVHPDTVEPVLDPLPFVEIPARVVHQADAGVLAARTGPEVVAPVPVPDQRETHAAVVHRLPILYIFK